MKDIKSYVIGFLTCACLFLIMGQTDSKPTSQQELVQAFLDVIPDVKPGEIENMANIVRYQYMSDHTEYRPYGGRNWEIWILDTSTGNIISATKTNRHQDTPLRESIKFTQIIADAEAHRWNANK